MSDKVLKKNLDNEIENIRVKFENGLFDEVLEHTLELQCTFPKSAALFMIVGDAFTKLNQLDEAIKNYKTVIKFQPNFAPSYYHLAIALEEKGNLDPAIDNYKMAIKVKPDYAEAYNNLGAALKVKGQIKNANKNFTIAIELKPSLAQPYFNKGLLLKEQGKLRLAVYYFKHAIKYNPNYMEAYLNMGDIFRSLGDLEGSIINYNHALELLPVNRRANDGIGISIRYYIRAIYNNLIKKSEKVENLIEIEKRKLRTNVEKRNIWFIDVPRTSSTAIKMLLGKKFYWPFGQSNLSYDSKNTNISRSFLTPDHTPSFIAKEYLGNDLWKQIETFAVVRNPYSWCASLWHFAKKYNDLGLKVHTFDQFLGSFEDKLVGDFNSREIYASSYSQSDYLVDCEGRKIVKSILKMEDRYSIDKYLRKMNISEYGKTHLIRFGNETKSNDFKLENSHMKKIERIFKKDFENLNY